MTQLNNSESNKSSLFLSKFPKKIQKVLVIGLGAGGILSLRNLKKINTNGYINVKCFELSKDCGGVWRYDDRVNLDNKDEFTDNTEFNCTTPMYDGLTTNVPGKIMTINEVPDNKCDDIYPTRHVIWQYLNNLVELDNLKEFVTFETKVLQVTYLIDEKQWKVKSVDMVTREETEELFDCVIDCSGFHNSNNIPNWAGIEDFKKKYPGRLFHSRYYRRASEFRGKSVVVVGKGPSAMNIVQELSYEPCTVTQSSRPFKIHKLGEKIVPQIPNNPDKPPTFVSPIVGFEIDSNTGESNNDRIILEDGTKLSIPDYLIAATGYKFHFAALPNNASDLLQPSNSQVIVDNDTIKNIVLRTIYKFNPTFMTIGMTKMSSLITLWDYQAHIIINTISMANYFHETRDYNPLFELIGDSWMNNEEGDKFDRTIINERYSYPIDLSLRINRAQIILPETYRTEFPIALIDPPSNEWMEEMTRYSLGLPPYNRD
ncbi:FAD/NAD(P)-binding domain-containing protein [Conidiobolus coronatus NRRL 28638]|uniref:FAD/NAD(P)-binding domain-containing protein n=1 Tax=Conidiobolus coronatus (strain ATCC 28846 / CBS 209.66 / NRRL 28638) TaxID=796925 RepID=A0A137P831_CONC2|nr:FAD/NAD(P)-binding domain-containing protein [Conidiobolus coronatus NRRL 28638]|eukprot:KXN71142.1 FAD/NAD(P)-binding domain-containing protein [Conidiobolus coronatus NRRL 28638]